MARESVIVPIHVLVDRALPPVCAVSGEPTEKLAEFRFSDSSLLRALTAAFVRAEHRRNFVTGSVPLSDRLLARRSALGWAGLTSGAAGLLAGIVGVALQARGPVVTMFGLFGAATLALVLRAAISPQGVLQGQYVWLTRVHPTFADAADDLVASVRRPRDDEQVMRAGIGPLPMRAVAGIAIWLFVIVWIAVR